jgi:[acyl-carrier-protein] S-malonyltransferase
MDEAATRLRQDLAKIKISTPEVPVVSNVTARPTTDAEEIRRNLAEQVKAPVLFQKGVEACLTLGTTLFLEPGPRNVLCGLVGKIAPGTPAVSIDSPADLEAFAATTTGKGATGKA